MKTLITGINGFVGRHLHQLLLESVCEVTGLIRSKMNLLNEKTQVYLVYDIKTCDSGSLTKGFLTLLYIYLH